MRLVLCVSTTCWRGNQTAVRPVLSVPTTCWRGNQNACFSFSTGGVLSLCIFSLDYILASFSSCIDTEPTYCPNISKFGCQTAAATVGSFASFFFAIFPHTPCKSRWGTRKTQPCPASSMRCPKERPRRIAAEFPSAARRRGEAAATRLGTGSGTPPRDAQGSRCLNVNYVRQKKTERKRKVGKRRLNRAFHLPIPYRHSLT